MSATRSICPQCHKLHRQGCPRLANRCLLHTGQLKGIKVSQRLDCHDSQYPAEPTNSSYFGCRQHVDPTAGQPRASFLMTCPSSSMCPTQLMTCPATALLADGDCLCQPFPMQATPACCSAASGTVHGSTMSLKTNRSLPTKKAGWSA